ncbi:hypothetical protein, partial [Mesorhizobium sp. M7A.F.Ca.MR.176.00.0.0]|uniref:hypothetical protein n=1 Tax=Mesorhizobium sp. M7A.F.Ca.MR.176.00.0.0 TaxID=2496776 RepID=UPI0019D4B5BF
LFTSAKSIPATRALRRMSQSRACDDTPDSELRESNEFGFLKYRIVDTDPDGSSLDDENNHLQTEYSTLPRAPGVPSNPTFARSAVTNDHGDRQHLSYSHGRRPGTFPRP